MSFNWLYLQGARQKMLYLVHFEQISLKTQPFFKNLTPNRQNSCVLEKKLKEFEKKLKLFGFKTQQTGSDQLHPLP